MLQLGSLMQSACCQFHGIKLQLKACRLLGEKRKLTVNIILKSPPEIGCLTNSIDFFLFLVLVS